MQGGEPYVYEDPNNPGQYIGFEVDLGFIEGPQTHPDLVLRPWLTDEMVRPLLDPTLYRLISEAGVHPKVTALVYVAARAPDAGEDYGALAATYPGPPRGRQPVHTVYVPADRVVPMCRLSAFTATSARTFGLKSPSSWMSFDTSTEPISVMPTVLYASMSPG